MSNLTTTNRDLLRHYKDLKGKLLRGEIQEIAVPQKNGVVIKVIVQKTITPFERMTKKILAKPFKNLKRPEEDII